MTKIRYGVIGLKGIGRRHLHLAQQNKNVELGALVDIDTAFVKQLSKQLGVPGFTDYRAMLDAGIVDAVSIATPHHLHAPIGLACLKAGVHIYVEKPLANRISEADAMISLAKEKNLKICVAHQYRTHRSSQVMKQLIDDNKIGKLMRMLWTWGEFRSEAYYSRDIWRATWEYAGGGVLANQVSHDLDLICWLMGAPRQVSAVIGKQLHHAEVEDTVCASVVFSSGALGSLQFTINQPRAYSVRQIAGDNGIIVIQDAKSLNKDENDKIELGTYSANLTYLCQQLKNHHEQPSIRWRRIKLPGSHIRSVRTMLRKILRPRRLWKYTGLLDIPEHGPALLMNSFIDAILTGTEPMVNGESARLAVELSNAIVLSALRKKTVDLPLDRGEYNKLFEELTSGISKIT